jgi:hypothetical protein
MARKISQTTTRRRILMTTMIISQMMTMDMDLMNLGTGQHLGWRICHHDPFGEVLGVLSERMVKRQELSMLVECRILATLLQPDKSHSCLANRA